VILIAFIFLFFGDPNVGVEQQFTHIIINKELYDKLYYEWFPNPTFGKEDEKKLLGLDIKNKKLTLSLYPVNVTV
jgi:hypothetical protein